MLAICRNPLILLGLLAGFIVISPGLFADEVYVTSADNQILGVSFDGTFPTVRAELGGALFQGLATRQDGGFVAADRSHGGRLIDCGPSCTSITGFSSATGVALDANENIYAVNATVGGADQLLIVDRLPGGYATPVAISVPKVKELADVTVARASVGKIQAGDVIILVGDPAEVKIYRRIADDPPRFDSFDFIKKFPPGTEPTGLAFDGHLHLLITTWGGKVLRYGPDGGQVDDFVDSLPGNGVRIAVGFINDREKAYVTVHNGGAVVRYGFVVPPNGDVTKIKGEEEAIATTGIQSPVGVALPESNFAPLLKSDDPVTVALPHSIDTIDRVTSDGVTFADCESYDDPRTSNEQDIYLCDPNGIETPGGCPATPGLDAVIDLGYPNKIPHYFQFFSRLNDGGDPIGSPIIRLCKITTTADVEGVRFSDGEEESWIGEEIHCNVARPPFTEISPPQGLFAEEPPNDPLFEGRVFINVTTECHSHSWSRWGPRGTLVVIAAHDTRDIAGPPIVRLNVDCDAGIVHCGLGTLGQTFDENSKCITRGSARNKMRKQLNNAISHFNNGEWTEARLSLEDFVDSVEKAERFFGGKCPAEWATELRVRAKASIYQLERLEAQP